MSKQQLALRVRKAEVEVLYVVEQWLRAKDRAQEICAQAAFDGMHGIASVLFDMRDQLGLPSYIKESIDIDEEIGEPDA